MIKAIVNLGLIVIPFIIINGFGTREPKLYAGLLFSLILGLLSFWYGLYKPLKNYWINILIVFFVISYFLAPKPDLKLFSDQVGMFWFWKSFLFILIYYLGFNAIQSIYFTKQDKNYLFNIISYVGLVMALYCLLQGLRIEQFYSISGLNNTVIIKGTLGSLGIVASFLAMIVPIVLYMRKFLFAIVMVIAIILTHSLVAIIALIVSLLFYLSTFGKKQFITACLLFLAMAVPILVFTYKDVKNHKFNADGYRFSVWKETVKETKNMPFTGLGLGTFNYTYYLKHHIPGEDYRQAHNDYIELMYNSGIIGLSLFLLSIYWLYKQTYKIKLIFNKTINRENMALLSSFTSIAICAGGLFIWQLGAHIYYTLIIAGLLHNNIRGGVV
ncbi:MAG: O-antigen ligase family protein [Candidatus Omnitrophica bacterium]|nr:O-antigen ligase family protein [Candidatus Omnitrophota bacterium]